MKKYLLTFLALAMFGGTYAAHAEVTYTYAKDTYNGCAVITDVSGAESVTQLDLPAQKPGDLLLIVGIGDRVFEKCPFEKVTIPDAITNIGAKAFYQCARLSNLTLPKELRLIGDWAFSDCAHLESVVIPSKVKSIGDWAFCSCRNLKSLEIGAGVESIGKGAFAYCTELKLNVASGCAYTMENGILYNKDKTELVWCDRAKKGTVTIASGVTNIAAYAFYGCTALTGIEIPESVVTIGDWAFGECAALADISLPTGLKALGSSAFSGCAAMKSLVVPGGVEAIWSWTFAGMTNLEEIAILDGVKQIGGYAFDACTKLARVEFGCEPPLCETDVWSDVASNAVGVYRAKYASAWQSAIDSSGKWNGLKMEMYPALTYTVDSYTGLYDGAAHGLTIRVQPSAAKIEYARASNGPWSTNIIQVTNAGTNTIYYRLSLDDYEMVLGSTNMIIRPRQITLTSADASKVYDGQPLVATNVTCVGFIAGEGVCTTVSGTQTAVGSSKNTFTYTFKNGTLAQNYSITKVEGTLTVTKSGDDPTPTPTPTPTPDNPDVDPDPTPTPTPTPEDETNYYLSPTNEVELADLSAAKVYNGYLYKAGDWTPCGTIQVKAAKQKTNKKTQLTTSKITTYIQMLGEKKQTVKGEMDVAECVLEASAKDGRKLILNLGADGLTGSFDDYTIDGARDYFSSKDKAEKSAATTILNGLKAEGAKVLAWQDENGWNSLSLTIGSKGKTKVAGTLSNGTKVSASMQLILGEDWYAIPVVVSKTKVQLAFTTWICRATGEVSVEGLEVSTNQVVAGKAGGLTTGATFQIDSAALAALLGDATYAAYYPTNMTITVSGTKWSLPKAGKVVVKNGVVDETKLKDNPSGLKLTYRSSSGTFSGSFKAYINNKGKAKSVTVSLAGVVVDGVGYGMATIKKAGSVSIQIRH